MGMAAAFSDENRTGPPINKPLTEMATKPLGKKLTQEKMLNLVAKYDPLGNLYRDDNSSG